MQTPQSNTANRSPGDTICQMLTPEAFRATISLSADILLKTSTVATSRESGRT